MKRLALLSWAAAVSFAGAAGGSEFQDTKYGYSVSAPEFPTAPPRGTVTALTVSAPAEAGFSANMNVTIQELRTTREQYIATTEKEFSGAGLKINSASKREVSGRPAVLFDYGGVLGGHSLHFLSLAVVLPERVLLVTCTAPTSAFAKHEGEFRRSLESFKLAAK